VKITFLHAANTFNGNYIISFCLIKLSLTVAKDTT